MLVFPAPPFHNLLVAQSAVFDVSNWRMCTQHERKMFVMLGKGLLVVRKIYFDAEWTYCLAGLGGTFRLLKVWED